VEPSGNAEERLRRDVVGAEIAIDDRWRIEPYFARRNDQRSEPAHVNAIGLALKYFR